MKKLLVLTLSAMILACGSVSASALVSPGLDDGSQGDNGQPTDATSATSVTSPTSSTQGGKVTSPSTGVSGKSAIFVALAALTCGGVAAIAKKKISE